MIGFLFGIAGAGCGLVGFSEVGYCFWHLCSVFVLPVPFPLHDIAKAGGHVLALVSPVVQCGTCSQRAVLLVSDL